MFLVECFDVLIERDGTMYTETLRKGYNSDTRVFTEKDGFQMAFAVLDSSRLDGTDPYGRELDDWLEIELT